MTIIVNPSGTTTWPDLTSEAITYVAGCPVFTVERQVKKAAREFLRRSCVWRDRKVDLLETVAEQDEYAFALPTNAELNRVHVAWYGTTEIDVQIPGEEDDTETTKTDSTWMVGVLPGGQGLRITPSPDADGVEVTGTVSYVTGSTAAGIPSWIFDEWGDAIAAGAAAHLLKQISRPWANPQASQMLQMEFDDAVSRASNSAGPVMRRPLRVSPA